MSEVNCTPQSEVMMSGTPNREIQPATRVSAHAVAVVQDIGIASSHLVDLSREHVGETTGRDR